MSNNQSQDRYDTSWEDENEDRVWYCQHNKKYGINCRKCEEENE